MFRRKKSVSAGLEKKKTKRKVNWKKAFAYGALGFVSAMAGIAVGLGIGLATFGGAAPIGAAVGVGTAASIFAAGTAVLSRRFGFPTSFRRKEKHKVGPTVEELEDKNAENEKRIKDLEAELQSARQETQAYRERNTDLLDQYSQNEADLLHARSDLSTLRERENELEQTVRALRDESERKDYLLRQGAQELGRQARRADVAEGQVHQLQQTIETLEQDKRTLQQALRSTRDESTQLQSALEATRQRSQGLTADLGTVTGERDQLEVQARGLGAQISGLEEHIQVLEERLNQAHAEQAVETEDYQRVLAEAAALRAELIRLQGIEAENAALQAQSARYSEALQVLDEENHDLRSRLDSAIHDNEGSLRALEEALQTAEGLEKELSRLRIELRGTKGALADEEQGHLDTQQDLARETARVRELQDESKQNHARIRELVSENESYEEDRNQIAGELTALHDRLRVREVELGQLTEENEGLRGGFTDLQRKTGALEIELQEATDLNADLAHRVSGRTQAEADFYKRYSELRTENKALVENVERLQADLHDQQVAFERQRSKDYEGYARNIDVARQRVSQAVGEAEASKRAAVEQLTVARAQLSENKHAIDRLLADNQKLRSGNHTLEQGLAQASESSNSARAALGATSAELESSRTEVIQARHEIARLKGQVMRLKEVGGEHEHLERALADRLAVAEARLYDVEGMEQPGAFGADSSPRGGAKIRQLGLSELDGYRKRSARLFDEPAIIFKALQDRGFAVVCKEGVDQGYSGPDRFKCPPSNGHVQLPFAFIPKAGAQPIFLEVKPKPGQTRSAFIDDLKQGLANAFEKIRTQHNSRYETLVYRKSFFTSGGGRDWILQNDPQVVYNPDDFGLSSLSRLAIQKGSPSRLSSAWKDEFEQLIQEGGGPGVQYVTSVQSSDLPRRLKK